MSYYLENRGKKPLNELIYQRPDLREAYSKRDPTMSDEYMQSLRNDEYALQAQNDQAKALGIDMSLIATDDMMMNKDELDLLKTKVR